ncbi:MAG TPA: hypothetical protein VK476_02360 [Flavobacterium sp.]|nr:hypothetical protein [Flavobacterium sp.]
MIKKILIAVFLLFSFVTIAQQATSSPYSFYGIGEVRFKGTVENRLMGSMAVIPDSIHINLQNPASYSSLKLATFTVGGSFNSSRLNSSQGNDKAQRTTVDYLAVGLPVGKSSGVTFGLLPYSSVGYRVSNEGYSVNETNQTIKILKKYEGKGGLNKVFAGYGYQINKNFRIGADLSYNFGTIETKSIRYQSDVDYGSQEKNTSEFSGITFNIGAMYERKINKHDFYSSFRFTPQSNLKSNNERVISSILYSEDYTPGIISQLTPIISNTTLKLPSEVAFGAGFGKSKKWVVGAEVTFKQSGDMTNRFSDITGASFENRIQYSLGGYFVPNYTSFSNYFKKITYRAGFRYEKTGLVIRNESIRDYSFTGGFGLPLGGAFSNLNVGLEYGRKGTAKANLVEENYMNVIMSFSLNDKWFVKRRYE